MLHYNKSTAKKNAHGGKIRTAVIGVENRLLINDDNLQIVLAMTLKSEGMENPPLGNNDGILLGEDLVSILLKFRVLINDIFANSTSSGRFYLTFGADVFVGEKPSNKHNGRLFYFLNMVAKQRMVKLSNKVFVTRWLLGW